MRGCCIQTFAFASVVQGSVSLVGAADTFSGEYMLLRSRYLGPFQVQSAAATLNHCNMKEFIAHFSIQPCWLQVITISHGLSASTKWFWIVAWHSFCRFFQGREKLFEHQLVQRRSDFWLDALSLNRQALSKRCAFQTKQLTIQASKRSSSSVTRASTIVLLEGSPLANAKLKIWTFVCPVDPLNVHSV